MALARRRPPADATGARVIRAAGTLFAERGFHGTTMRDIAERAGANVASGHYHFGSKRDLYLAVLHPATRHALRGMTLGDVDREWALEHHRKWAESADPTSSAEDPAHGPSATLDPPLSGAR